mgnify:CR=1 FL=1
MRADVRILFDIQLFKVIARLSDALFSVFYRFLGAIADTGHAVGAVFAPYGSSAFEPNVVQRTPLGALPASDAALCGAKCVCFYKYPIKQGVYRPAHKAVIKVVSGSGEGFALTDV